MPSTTLVSSVLGEYRRYRRLAELALEQLDDEQLHARTDADANSVAILVHHLAGNLRSRFTDFLTTDGEKPWRERDREFEPPDLTRAELLAAWSSAWDVVELSLGALTPTDLEVEVTIRGKALTVTEALYRSVAHVAYHVGQLVLLARQARGSAWTSLSIPRGGSAAYARQPTRERGPDG